MNEVSTSTSLGQEKMVKLCLMNILFDTFRSFWQGICLEARDYTSSSSVFKTTNTSLPQLDLFHFQFHWTRFLPSPLKHFLLCFPVQYSAVKRRVRERSQDVLGKQAVNFLINSGIITKPKLWNTCADNICKAASCPFLPFRVCDLVLSVSWPSNYHGIKFIKRTLSE